MKLSLNKKSEKHLGLKIFWVKSSQIFWLEHFFKKVKSNILASKIFHTIHQVSYNDAWKAKPKVTTLLSIRPNKKLYTRRTPVLATVNNPIPRKKISIDIPKISRHPRKSRISWKIIYIDLLHLKLAEMKQKIYCD